MSWTEASRLLASWRRRQVPKLTQEGLGHWVGVSTATIGRLERATEDPNIGEHTLYKVAMAMEGELGERFLREAGYDELADTFAIDADRLPKPGTKAETSSRQSLSYGGAPLSPEQEDAVREMIRTIQRASGDRL